MNAPTQQAPEDAAGTPDVSVYPGMPDGSTSSGDVGVMDPSEGMPTGSPPPAESAPSTIDIDGQPVPMDEAVAAFKNRAAWQKSNTQKAQELSALQTNLAEREKQLGIGQGRPPAPPQAPVQSEAPDPVDNPSAFKQWLANRDRGLSGQVQGQVETLVEQQLTMARHKDETTRMQSKFFEDHADDLAPGEWDDVYNMVKTDIRLVREDGTVNTGALEVALTAVRSRNGVQAKNLERAKAEGATQAVDELNSRRDASVLKGQSGTAPSQKRDAAFYMSHPEEFDALSPERQMSVASAFAKLPAADQNKFLRGGYAG